MTDELGYELRGRTAVITLNRPARRNAVNESLARSMREALDRIERDDTVLAVVLTGSGDKAFCAGMDLDSFLSGKAGEVVGGPGGFAGFVRHALSRPVIAAVNGAALGGGMELALACDMIVASEEAVFGLPEVAVGLYPAAGGAFRLPRAIPGVRAVEMMLTGVPMTAREALELGMLNRVVPRDALMDTALELARRIQANAPLAVRAALELARRARRTEEESLWAANRELWDMVRESRDAEEGPRAFLEKRKPEWNGR